VDIALLLIAARALIPTKLTVLEPIGFELPTITAAEATELYLEGGLGTLSPLLTFEEWRQQINPSGTRDQYFQYVTRFT